MKETCDADLMCQWQLRHTAQRTPRCLVPVYLAMILLLGACEMPRVAVPFADGSAVGQPAAEAHALAPQPSEVPGVPGNTQGHRRVQSHRPQGLVDARLEQLLVEVAGVRSLPMPRELHLRVETPQEMQKLVGATSTMDPGAAYLNDALVQLRLIHTDNDLAAARARVAGHGVRGMYVPRRHTIYINREDWGGSRGGSNQPRLTGEEIPIAVHEIVHAMQAEAFGVEALRTQETLLSDEDMAALSLIEGDAGSTALRWQAAHDSVRRPRSGVARTRSKEDDSPPGDGSPHRLRHYPRYILAAHAFPYVHGTRFVEHIVENAGEEALNRLFSDPPTTTEQILHPQRFLDGEGSIAVEVHGVPGDGWSRAISRTFGEFHLRQLLYPLGHERASVAGDGWAGGRIDVWTRQHSREEQKEVAVSVGLAFDSAADRREACDALAAWQELSSGPRSSSPGDLHMIERSPESAPNGPTLTHSVTRVECAERRVLLAVGPTAPIAERLLQG